MPNLSSNWLFLLANFSFILYIIDTLYKEIKEKRKL